MEFNLDNFITYSDSPVLFPNENFPDFDFPMLSPFQNPSPSPGHQQNFSSSYPDSLNPSNSSPPSTNSYSTGSRPQIVNKKDSKELKQISNKTKTVQKRNSAKARAKVKHDTEKVLENAAKKFITADLEDPNLDLKTKRHLIQKVKNRIAAQKSRDSKKNYITELEEIRDRLQEEARDLNAKNNFLLEKVKELELARVQLLAENEGLRRRNVEQNVQLNEENIVNLNPIASPEEENNQQLEGDINTVLTRQTHQKNNCLGYFVSFTAILAIYWGFKMAHIGILQSEGQERSMKRFSRSPSTYTSNVYIVNTSLEISNEDASSQESLTEIAFNEVDTEKVAYTFTEQMKSNVRYRVEVAHQADDKAIAESAAAAVKLMSDQKSKKASEKIDYYYSPQTDQMSGSPFGSDPAEEPSYYYYPSETNLSPNYSLSSTSGSEKSYGFASNLVFSILPLLLFFLYWL